jgi:hypothetical protein
MPSRLRRLVRWLRRHYPLQRKVVIRLYPQHKLPGLHGEMEISDEEPHRLVIRIARSSEEVMIETMVEEYCHAMRHECPVPVQSEHDGIFWAIYGHITMHYRGGE